MRSIGLTLKSSNQIVTNTLKKSCKLVLLIKYYNTLEKYTDDDINTNKAHALLQKYMHYSCSLAHHHLCFNGCFGEHKLGCFLG